MKKDKIIIFDPLGVLKKFAEEIKKFAEESKKAGKEEQMKGRSET